VNGLAKRFVRHCRGVELLDLVQDGNEALVHALEKYDVRRGESSFRTFAFTWIRTALLAVVWQYQGALRLPMHELRAIRQMGLITTRLLAELGREPTLAEMAVEMEVSEKDVRDLIVLQEQAVVSIHAFPDGDEDCTLEDTIVDPLSLADSDEDLRDLLADALVMLPDRERIVINLRYGFEDGQARTQKEVAYLLGVSAARVAQLDRRAQMRLRKLLCAA